MICQGNIGRVLPAAVRGAGWRGFCGEPHHRRLYSTDYHPQHLHQRLRQLPQEGGDIQKDTEVHWIEIIDYRILNKKPTCRSKIINKKEKRREDIQRKIDYQPNKCTERHLLKKNKVIDVLLRVLHRLFMEGQRNRLQLRNTVYFKHFQFFLPCGCYGRFYVINARSSRTANIKGCCGPFKTSPLLYNIDCSGHMDGKKEAYSKTYPELRTVP